MNLTLTALGRMQFCITHFIAILDCTYPVVYALFMSIIGVGDNLTLYANDLLKSRGAASKDSIRHLIDLHLDRKPHDNNWIVAQCAGACGFEDLLWPILKQQFGFDEIITGAIIGGRVDIVDRIFSMHGTPDALFLNICLDDSVKYGNRELCEFFLNRGAVASTSNLRRLINIV